MYVMYLYNICIHNDDAKHEVLRMFGSTNYNLNTKNIYV